MISMKFLPGWSARAACGLMTREPQVVQKIIEKILRTFDVKDCLYGFFQAMSSSVVSPFVATHDYCIKVNECDPLGHVTMNISPIYHLGLEYPNHYKNKHGKDLEQEAIIGLLETPVVGTLPPGHTAYSYGIDAGILFKDSKLSHNKKMELTIEEIHKGLLVTLNCENETTSTTLSWDDVGVHSFEAKENDTQILTELG